MTSWVILIDKQHPNHWSIAKQSGFWDLTKHRDILAGDDVYFWQGGKSFVGRGRALTAAAALEPGMPASWEDSGVRQYESRFTFEVLDESPTSKPQWFKDIGPQLQGKAPDLRNIPGFVGDDESVLASYFERSPMTASFMEARMQALLEDAGIGQPSLDVEGMTEDQRKLVEKFVKLREGQEKFRADLLAAYDACAVTGTTVDRTLDAAHISDYKGKHTQVVANGILLRTDVHRLFDAKRLTVTADDYLVRISPELDGTPYSAFHEQPLHVPPLPADQPNRDLLKKHNADCRDWLTS